MAIGVINYPKLRWKFVPGRCHTVPVGYDENGQARVVMDILLFEDMTADESIRFACLKKHSAKQIHLPASRRRLYLPFARLLAARRRSLPNLVVRHSLLTFPDG